MQAQETFIAVAIAFVFQLFFSKLCDAITDTENINNMCRTEFVSLTKIGEKLGEAQSCYEQQRIRREKAQATKFYLLMTIGVVGLVMAAFFMPNSLNSAVGFGIGLGSLMLLVSSSYAYWGYMGENVKLAFTGVAFAVLVAAATYFGGRGGSVFYM